jgi:hypothetical protein
MAKDELVNVVLFEAAPQKYRTRSFCNCLEAGECHVNPSKNKGLRP